MKSYISQIADNLVFEQNTIATRNNFLSQVNPYLESVQQRQGLYAFKVVMDDTNNTPDVIDRNQLVGAIYIHGILRCGDIADEERAVKVMGETRVPNGKAKLFITSKMKPAAIFPSALRLYSSNGMIQR